MRSLDKVHKRIQEDRIKRDVMRKVEDRLITDVTAGMKAVFLLALKKEGLDKQRAIRLWQETEKIEQALHDGDITWEDIYAQVKEEYGLEIKIERL